MAVSSTEVQNEFIKLRQFLMESMGQVMPEGVPSPMEAAMMQQQEMGPEGGPALPFPQQGVA